MVEETPWFLPTETPVRVGVYKTKHRTADGKVIEGYSCWLRTQKWSATCKTAKSAAYETWGSAQQSKAWCGLTEEQK